MRRELRLDLSRWEAGEISTARLAGAHPTADVVGLTSLHARLTSLTAEASPDPSTTWEALRDRLPERARVAVLPNRGRRAVIAVIAAVFLGGSSIAYAAGVEQVRETIHDVADGLRNLFGDRPGGSPEPAPGTGDGGGTDDRVDPRPVEQDEDDDERRDENRERDDDDGRHDDEPDDGDDEDSGDNADSGDIDDDELDDAEADDDRDDSGSPNSGGEEARDDDADRSGPGGDEDDGEDAFDD